jgi:hypothetical protein
MHFSVPVLIISERPDYASSYVICFYNLFSSINPGSKANTFCFLSSLPLLPPATTAMFGVSLLSTNTDHRYMLAYPYYWRGFVGAKMKTSVGPLVLIPL